MMGILSNGFKTSKSGSLVIMQPALPESANSRNISSLGSRQALTLCTTAINNDSTLCLTKNLFLSTSLKYLLNLLRYSTSFSSAYTSSESKIFPILRAFSNAWSVTEPLNSAALINTLVSKTKFNYFPFRSCSSCSGVKPCFCAYALMSSITSRSVLLSSISRLIISANSFFSVSVNLEKRAAVSSDVSSVMVFIQQR